MLDAKEASKPFVDEDSDLTPRPHPAPAFDIIEGMVGDGGEFHVTKKYGYIPDVETARVVEQAERVLAEPGVAPSAAITSASTTTPAIAPEVDHDPELATKAEAAQILRCSERTIQKHCRAGRLQATRAVDGPGSSRVLITRASIAALLASRSR